MPKLTRLGLRQLIKEEMSRMTEIDTTSGVDRAAVEISTQWHDGQNLEGPGGRLSTLKFFLKRLKEFDPAQARSRTKRSTAMGDFVFNDFDESGIPVEQHPALAEKVLGLMATQSLSEGAAKPPQIEQYLAAHGLTLGPDYEIAGDGVSEDYHIVNVGPRMAEAIASMLDPDAPYEDNPLYGTRYRIEIRDNEVRWS
jgi:hypothetical protein